MKKMTTTSFDWIAPVYDSLAFIVFGQKLQRAQTLFLSHIPADASVLLVGGGTGWLLEQVLVNCRPARVLYLESSVRMVALSSERMVRNAVLGTVDFQVNNDFKLPPGEQFDVIITPFLLDLFTEETVSSTLIPTLRNALKPNGRWLITDFIRTDVWWQRALLWSMIRFFRLTANIETNQLVDWQQLMAQSGLSRQRCQAQAGGMVSAEIWMLPELHPERVS